MGERRRRIRCVVLPALCLGSSVALAGQRPPLKLAIEMRDLARVPPAIMREAKVEVERTFLASGVQIVWVEPGGAPRNMLPLKVMVLGPVAPALRSDQQAGEAILGRASQAGDWAQVFYGRVVAAVEQRQISIGLVLASVISHELGHLLLPPGSHTHFGIMQRAVDLEIPSLRRFTNEQARQIRAAAATGRRYASRCDH